MPREFDPDRFRRGDRDPRNYVDAVVATMLRRIFFR
jgi:hypothetical protein